MAQHDYVIDNANGASVRSDLNNALAAIASNNSGTSAPSTTYAYQWWFDTTNAKIKIRNSTNSAWVEFANFSSSLAALLPALGSASAPSHSFTGDENTGMWSPGADTIAWSTAGTERMRLGSTGVLTFGTAPVASLAEACFGTSGASSGMVAFTASNASYTSSVVTSSIARTATSACNFFVAQSDYDGTPDTEFYVRGDGIVAGDQAYTTGADYAEMFEWDDGNPDDLPRVGRSVTLVGNKIRLAAPGDDPIGIVSARPTIIGDSAELRWNERYLKDDFGRYDMETYLALDPGTGATVELKRRKPNPAWNPGQAYVPRSRRKEWAAVGLMGKLRLRKGQVTGARWVKLRDISDQVEEWLVR